MDCGQSSTTQKTTTDSRNGEECASVLEDFFVDQSCCQLGPEDQWYELSSTEQSRYRLPNGARWFGGKGSQTPMLKLYAKYGGYTLGWDNNSGGKLFGLYPCITKEELMTRILQVPVEYRNAYELIPSSVSCCAYADIDFEGQPDPYHTMLKKVIALFNRKALERYNVEPDIFCLCGSRPGKSANDQPPLFKHSYHIVMRNVVFERNDTSEIKSFFHTDDNDFYWVDQGKRKCVIDPKVYTANRQFRLPYCCKRGSTVPLKPVNLDGDEVDFSANEDRMPEAAALYFVAAPLVDDTVKFISKTALQPPSVNQSAAKRARTTEQPQNNRFPVPLSMVQELLKLAGDSVTTLTKIQYLQEEDAWKIQGDQKKQQRPCLVTQGSTHEKNNCLLFVDHLDVGFRFRLHCTASECRSCPKPTLGSIAYCTTSHQWQIEMEQQFQPAPADAMEEDAPTPVPQSPDRPMTVPCNQGGCSSSIPRDGDGDGGGGHDSEDDETEFSDPKYKKMKIEFEKECFKIKDPFMYARLGTKAKKESGPSYLKHHELGQFYSHLSYHVQIGKKRVRKSFIEVWLRDPEKRQYDRIETNCFETTPGCFNIWPGFSAAKLPPVPPESVQELVQPFIRHVRDVLANGDEDVTQWLLDWFANMVQRPHMPSHVLLIFRGLQGCGKGILFDFYRNKVLGELCSTQTDNPEQNCFGKHASCWINAVLFQIDEAKSMYEYIERVKNSVTASERIYEGKNKAEIPLPNLCNFVITTNNKNPVRIDPDDRRCALFEVSQIYKGNHVYWLELASHLAHQDVARAIFQYMMERDLTKYKFDFQETRPRTDLFYEAQTLNIPVLKRFASGIVNDAMSKHCADEPGNVTQQCQNTQHLFEQCKAFALKGNYHFSYSLVGFSKELQRLPGFTNRKTQGRTVYTIDCTFAKQSLQRSFEYDEDATLENLEPRYRLDNMEGYVWLPQGP